MIETAVFGGSTQYCRVRVLVTEYTILVYVEH